MSIESVADRAIRRFRVSGVTFPQFVLELERAVDLAEVANDYRATELRRLWGELEIINALGDRVSIEPSDQEDVDQAVRQIELLLADYVGP